MQLMETGSQPILRAHAQSRPANSPHLRELNLLWKYNLIIPEVQITDIPAVITNVD